MARRLAFLPIAASIGVTVLIALTVVACNLPFFSIGTPRAAIDPSPGTYSERIWVEPRADSGETFYISFVENTPFGDFARWWDGIEISADTTFWYYSISSGGQRSKIIEAKYTIKDASAPELPDTGVGIYSRGYNTYWVGWQAVESSDGTTTIPSDDLTSFWQLECAVYSSASGNIATYDDAQANGTLEMTWTSFDALRELFDTDSNRLAEYNQNGGYAGMKYFAARAGASRWFNVFVRDLAGNVSAYGQRKLASARAMSIYTAEPASADGLLSVNLMDPTPSADPSYATALAINVNTTTNIESAAMGDINGDGYDDLLVRYSDLGSGRYRWYPADGTGGITVTSGVELMSETDDGYDRNVVLCDFSGDSRKEMVFATKGGMLVVYAYPAAIVTSISVVAMRVAAGDVDGDGDTDIVALNTTSGAISVFLNQGGTSLTQVTQSWTGAAGAADVELGDLDRDGMADIVVAGASMSPSNVMIYRATGSGLFTYSSASEADFNGIADGTTNISIADFTPTVAGTPRDGLPDIFTGNSNTASAVYRNLGGLRFTKLTDPDFISDSSSDSIVVYANSDVWPDIIENFSTAADGPTIWLNDGGNGVVAGPTVGTLTSVGIAAGQVR